MRVGRSLGRLFGRNGNKFGFWPLRSVTALGNVSERGDRKTVAARTKKAQLLRPGLIDQRRSRFSTL
jgi:hypothetical protein